LGCSSWLNTCMLSSTLC